MLAATITAALPVAVLGGGHAPPSAACAATLDKYCGDQHNPDLRVCYASMRKNHRTIPLLAGFSGPGSRRWRCYSPDDLEGPDSAAKPLLNRTYSSGIAYCSNSAQLEALLRKCDPGFTPPPPPPPPAGPTGAVPVLVFSGGGIPSLVYVPTPEGVGNGTLIGFSEWSGKCPDASATCTLGSRRSTDLGATWLAATFPADEAVGIPNPGAHSHWCCPQSTYDARTGSVVLQFSNSTSVKGGCDINVEQLGGVLQVRSTDAGKSWFDYRNIQTELEFPKKPLNCLAPTSGQGLVMRPVNGKYGGRLVFCAVRNAYQGDVPVWSDDGGSTYNFSTGLYLPGLDECNIAQAANGSLFLISRNCREGDLNKCQMSDMVSNSGIRGVKSDGTGNHHFVYSISNDGGETWSPPRDQPQMVTPVCMASVISHRGLSDSSYSLYYSSPYSATARVNLTILASDDNGATFNRSLNLWPGSAGYTGLACGMPGDNDCGVMFSSTGGLNFLPFSSKDVK